MIHVQIASDITTVGVEGVRWVLVDASESDPPAAPAPSSALPTPPQAQAAAPPARGGQRRIGLWQLAITGLGLLAALGLAQRQLGLPGLPWLAVPAVNLPMAPLPPVPVAAPPIDAAGLGPTPALRDSPPEDPSVSDGPGSALPAPAASAAQPERLITAGFR